MYQNRIESQNENQQYVYAKTKAQTIFGVTAKRISASVFATDGTIPFVLKFEISSF